MSAQTCTSYWWADGAADSDHGVSVSTPPHRCTLKDTGIGTGLEIRHEECVCACAATATRPAPQEPEDLGGIDRTTVRVDEHGTGKVMVGLTDVSKLVSGGTVEFKAGRATTVTLGFPLAVMALSGGRGQVDEETAKALELLGWSGPDTELLRQRDLREALDHFAPADPDANWDALLLCVRGTAFRLKHEPIALAVLLDLPSTASMESIEVKVRELQAKAGEQP